MYEVPVHSMLSLKIKMYNGRDSIPGRGGGGEGGHALDRRLTLIKAGGDGR